MNNKPTATQREEVESMFPGNEKKIPPKIQPSPNETNGKTISTTHAKDSILKVNGKKHDTIYGLIESLKPEIEKALPKHIDIERFSRVILTEFRKNPELIKCTPQSLMGAVLTASQLGLEIGPVLGHCYLVPYKGQIEFQIGYRGMLELSRRTGEIDTLYAECVYENDAFNVQMGLDATIEHTPFFDGDRGKFKCVYAIAKFKNGGYNFKIMTKHEIDKIKAKAATQKIWNEWYDQMALKTVVKQLFKFLPISVELVSKIAENDGVIRSEVRPNMTELSEKDVIPTEAIDI
jgi:recombination protein RecT